MEARYRFYEVVRVRTQGGHYDGLEGAVLGIAQDEPGGRGYAVHLYELEEVHYFSEEELESTGKQDKRENFYGGTTVRVIVDPETGEGRIANSDD
jgi:hypothetical protein